MSGEHGESSEAVGDQPSLEEVMAVSKALGISWSADELPALKSLVAGVTGAYRRLLGDNLPAGAPARAMRWFWPSPDENRTRGWKCRITPEPNDAGILADLSIVVKDSIAIAGVPMTCGSPLLQHYVAPDDATVVRRVRDAGGRIVGTGVCEDLCFSGSSVTGADGIVPNPYDSSRVSGGSTSGCAVLVATGEADVGIGTDQGGSIRGPAAWCGIFGIKPTYGLVPYTGALELERSIDHIGFMARDPGDLARVLSSVSGPDRSDTRSAGLGPVADSSVAGPKQVGLVQEAFGWPNSDPETDEIARSGIARLGDLGMEIHQVSVPSFRDGIQIITAILTGGSLAMLLAGQDSAHQTAGNVEAALRLARRGQHGAANLPLALRVHLVAGTVALGHIGSYGYGMARRRARDLRAEVDRLLDTDTVLAFPTMPHKPPPAQQVVDIGQFLNTTLGMSKNNCVFNLSGHPAVSIPCGITDDGLPVGLTLVGRHGSDRVLLDLAILYQEVFTLHAPVSR